MRKRVPHRTARIVGWLCETAYRVLRLPGEPPMTRFLADHLAVCHYFDQSRARKELDYRPHVDNGTGLDRLVRWLRDSGRIPRPENRPGNENR